MEISRGNIVKAIAGRDSGKFFVVVGIQEGYAFIADGKERKLEKPKRKSIKHLRLTHTGIELDDFTNKRLKNVLSEFVRKDGNLPEVLKTDN